MENFLEKYIEEIEYDSLNDWCIPDLKEFSKTKTMYDYQEKAIKNAIKTLYSYYKKDLAKNFYNYLKNSNKNIEEYDIKNVPSDEKNSTQKNKRYNMFSNYYKTDDNNTIKAYQFLNRMCFWMATGSGKTIVIIKLIEAIQYLQSQNLMPKYDILLLFPREDLIEQFKKEVESYNKGKAKKIELISLKQYDEQKAIISLFDENKVYYYRSDLIRDNKTENCIDYKDYLNSGKWFIFLDEAHRGEKQSSLLQDYVTIMSSKGYLFNFSATFTDKIDYITTCYNFNLEKFINSGYGKNIYLNQSYFDFNQKTLDYTSEEKKKQVLKSLIVLTLAKKSKKKGFYHEPLLMTLVNSVNTKDSDLLLFFKKIEEIAAGDLDENLLEEAKNDLISDFNANKNYMFGKEKLEIDLGILRKIQIKDIFKNVFNAETHGKIQLIKGERGKEYALQLETSEKPFGLIKIGDADKFQKEQLGKNYILINSYESNKSFFKNLNNDPSINILIGSRSFYEGWDSNRPNVINLINIGGNEAKKYVLQSIGRGIRIEPSYGQRKRLKFNDENKNIILETLFIFATNKGAVKLILEAIYEEKQNETNEYEISLEKNKIPFSLLVPEYKEKEINNDISLFNISSKSLNMLCNYFYAHSKELFMLKYDIYEEMYEILKNSVSKTEWTKYYQINEEFNYENIKMLVERILTHLKTKSKEISRITTIKENTINHFNKIKLLNCTNEEIELFKDKVGKVKNHSDIDLDELISQYKSGKISQEEFLNKTKSTKSDEKFKDIEIVNMPNHYYRPLLYSEVEKIDYAKNIIQNESEVKFIKALIKHVGENKNENWVFSKIEENVDNIYIPYYSATENKYKNFYPDFVFWIKENKNYRVVFIDPKGTSHADYQNKIDGYNKLFVKGNKPIVFNYGEYKVTFDLKLVTDDVNKVGKLYKKYWLNVNDFSWLI